MKSLKIEAIVVLALAIGVFIGLYSYQWFSRDVESDIDNKIEELRNIDTKIEANLNFYDNVSAFEYITLLQHLEDDQSKEIEEILKTYLIKSYRLALEWSESEIEEDHHKEINLRLIDKIDELSKDSKLFSEIRETGKNDS